jgi:hypothetical protein
VKNKKEERWAKEQTQMKCLRGLTNRMPEVREKHPPGERFKQTLEEPK